MLLDTECVFESVWVVHWETLGLLVVEVDKHRVGV